MYVLTRPVRRGLMILLIGCVVATGFWLPARAQDVCAASHCAWLPLVNNAAPVAFLPFPYVRLEGGTLTVEGELVATGAQPVYNVILEAQLTNAAGVVVQTIPITPVLDMTAPTASNPFALKATGCCDATRAVLQIRSWHLTSPQSYVNLPVETRRWSSGGGFAVAVYNTTPHPVYDVVVAVRISFTETFTQRYVVLAPNETVVYAEPQANDPFGFRFKSWAQGQRDP